MELKLNETTLNWLADMESSTCLGKKVAERKAQRSEAKRTRKALKSLGQPRQSH
jgi:hypothetical protein